MIANTRRAWLPGDARGFRNRGHRIHSSGDYRNPPPGNEHEGLRRYHRERSGKPVSLTLEVRILVLKAFVQKMRKLGYRIITASCGEKHLHGVAELVADYRECRKIVGKCKQKASHAVRDHLRGTIWAEGGSHEPIRDPGHFHNTYKYIRTKQEAGTVVWSHRPDEDWINAPSIGIVVMGLNKRRIRVFAGAQTPASERK